MDVPKSSFIGCFFISGALLLLSAAGVGIFYLTEVRGKNVSHSQDESRFDPILAKEEVLALVGPGFGFSLMSATYVRSSGTQDFSNKDYSPQTAFTFVGKGKGESVPVGAMAPNVPSVAISVRAKGWYSTSYRPGQRSYHYNYGLSRRESSSAGLKVADFPACRFKMFWDYAIGKGAPKDALASIDFRDSEYRFRISGTEFDYRFDQKCKILQ